MKREEIKKYLDELYLKANDEEELDYICEFVDNVLQDFSFVDKINTDNVIPAHWPFDLENTYLRDDEVDHLLTNEEALQNATQTQDGFVKYIKVV